MRDRRRPGPTADIWGDLDLKWTRVAVAVLAGSGALGSAVGLTAASAWLIARAAEMPSPADLAIAAVLVRTLGVGRGVLRYVERLRSHDTALRGVASLRMRLYERLESGPASHVITLPRSEVVARAGTDLDALGDAVVRAIIPFGVALVVSSISVGIVASQHRGASAALALCLVVAGLVPTILTLGAMRESQEEGAAAEGEVAQAAIFALEGATEHRVWGTTEDATTRLDEANTRLDLSQESAARPRAFAAALQVLASGAAVLSAVAIGRAAVMSGDLTGPAAAVVALTPLAAFEAVAALPAASAQAFRSRIAANRVRGLIAPTKSSTPPAPTTDSPPRLSLDLDRVQAAWPNGTPTQPVTAHLTPGDALGIIGPSGIGKTTLLLTIAGALPPYSGEVRLPGRAVTPDDCGTVIAMTAEDSHIFGTSVLENLRAARGDVTREDALRVISIVGLDPWLAHQENGLDTPLGSGGLSISGGERRRLLLARMLLSPAPIHLIDEPAEHLDDAGIDTLRAIIKVSRASGTIVIIVTHEHDILDVVDTVVDLGSGG